MFPKSTLGISIMALLTGGAIASPTALGSGPPIATELPKPKDIHWINEPQRNMYCRYNPQDCQSQFPDYCDNTRSRPIPIWCNDRGQNDDDGYAAAKAVTLVSRQNGNPQRINFCYYNPADCHVTWPEYCTESEQPPEWCYDFRRSKRSATLAPNNINHEESIYWCEKHPKACKALTLRLVAEADSSDDAANQDDAWAYPVHSICMKNPEWPECIYLAESTNPTIVARNHLFNASTVAGPSHGKDFCTRWPLHQYCNKTYCWGSGHACPPRLAYALLPSHLASPTNRLGLAARQEADPKRITPLPWDPPEPDTDRFIPDPPDSRPTPVTRDWCKHHPNHSYCSSQWCADHPNQCKGALDPLPTDEERSARCSEVYKLNWDDYGRLPRGCQMRCFDLTDRRGECTFRTNQWCAEHPDHRDCDVPT